MGPRAPARGPPSLLTWPSRVRARVEGRNREGPSRGHGHGQRSHGRRARQAAVGAGAFWGEGAVWGSGGAAAIAKPVWGAGVVVAKGKNAVSAESKARGRHARATAGWLRHPSQEPIASAFLSAQHLRCRLMHLAVILTTFEK